MAWTGDSSPQEYPGYLGMTTISPGGSDQNARIIVYRFTDKPSMDKWQNSEERAALVKEVEQYAEQQYAEATGMETWFSLPNMRAVVAPPRWKMALVTLAAAYVISLSSRIVLAPFLGPFPLEASNLVYAAILSSA
jgi:antibiotic biosynthesis monooxygenase (ABM) superfamily enzyme